MGHNHPINWWMNIPTAAWRLTSRFELQGGLQRVFSLAPHHHVALPWRTPESGRKSSWNWILDWLLMSRPGQQSTSINWILIVLIGDHIANHYSSSLISSLVNEHQRAIHLAYQQKKNKYNCSSAVSFLRHVDASPSVLDSGRRVHTKVGTIPWNDFFSQTITDQGGMFPGSPNRWKSTRHGFW